MKTPVIAIGLDAAEPTLLETWMDRGHLPNLDRVRKQGVYSRLHNTVNYQDRQAEFSTTEPLWVMMATGCLPDKTGFWDTITYDPQDYRIGFEPVYGGYDYQEYPPFYALGDRYKVATFDVPVTRVVPDVRGVQITGWGGHHPFYPSASQPAHLLGDIEAKYGKNPVYQKDNGIWWDKQYFDWVVKSVDHSVDTRLQICSDLLKQEDWDLFLVGFGELHTLGHDLYHHSQPDHPLYSHPRWEVEADPLLQGFERVDSAVGQLIDRAPANARIVLFSLHGMAPNLSDLLSMALLPEVMYRYNFPGQVALGGGDTTSPPPPIITKNIRNGWSAEIWRLMHASNPLQRLWQNWAPKQFLRGSRHGLLSPYHLMETDSELGWMPAMWYRPLWSQMKAFALPAFAGGHIRINLQGRERNGIVAPADYDAVCDEITDLLHRLRDGRTQQPLVERVVRTRKSPLDNDPKLPEPDLVVHWHYLPTDVIDSPDCGRIGPITYNRTGGHRPEGFLMASGPGINPGTELATGGAVDVGATLLQLMGADIPAHFDGKPLLPNSVNLP